MGKDGAKKDDFETRFTKIEDMLKELKSIFMTRTDEIDEQIQKVIESQTFISKQYDQFRTVIDNLMKDNTELRKQNDQIQRRTDKIERELKLAKMETNELEQYGRRTMIEIAGIPRSTEENAEDLVLKLGKQVDINLTPSDIEAAHRLSPKESANIIVKFANRKTRDIVYSRRTYLRNCTTHDLGIAVERQATKLFINESLTRRNKVVFSAALRFKKQHKYKYLWTRNGVIYLRKSDTATPSRVNNDDDLEKLVKLERDLPNSSSDTA